VTTTPEQHPADSGTRDIPPDVLSIADRARMRIDQLLGGAPMALVAAAYRRGRDDAAGGAPDLSDAALSLTAKAVNSARPGVETHTARATIEALLVLGWRPPPAATADHHARPAEAHGGCPEPVWDGPYSFRCGKGGGGTVCATHGSFARPAGETED
jgi:hypothetical protein